MTDPAHTSQVNPTMGIREWGLILFLALIWGGSFFFIGVAVKELPPFTIVWARVTLAALILVGILKLRGLSLPRDLSTWGAFMVMGCLNNALPFCLIVWGQTRIPSGLASILNATTPIFGVILAHFLTQGEKLTFNRGAGVLLGWIGVTLLIGVDAVTGAGSAVLGQVAVLVAASLYAVATIYGRRFKDLNPMVVATGMLSAASIQILPLTLFADKPWLLSPGTDTLMALAGLAAVSTALAYTIYFYLLPRVGPTNVLLVTFLIPVSAISLGVMFLNESLGWNAFAGLAGIFGGLLLIDGRITARFKKTKPQSA